MTISAASKASVMADLPYLFRLKELTVQIAQWFSLDPHIVMGVLSRESGAGRLLGQWGNPTGTGDRGHGRGVMQADDRTWKGLLDLNRDGIEDDAWRNPAFSIAFGCWLLDHNLDAFKRKYGGDRWGEALAAYNCGTARVERAIEEGKPVDAYTAGRNYSRDVLDRAGFILNLGA